MRTWTVKEVRSAIENPHNVRWVSIAVVIVASNQTRDEIDSFSTNHQNGRGFNGADAGKGTYWAEYCMGGKTFDPQQIKCDLSGKHLVEARGVMAKYARQVTEYLNEWEKMEHERC